MRKFIVVIVVIMVMAATACSVSAEPTFATRGRLTPEAGQYVVSTNGDETVITNKSSGRNNREIYWDATGPVSSGATQCTTWKSGTDIAQNGMAFRITEQSGGLNAIVFERNIWAYAYWQFVPIMFHTGSDYDQAFDSSLAGVDMSPYLGVGKDAVYPLRVCASLGDDDIIRFAMAKPGDTMPSLNEPGLQGGQIVLDVGKYYHDDQGKTGQNGGIYVAHVPAGTSSVITDNTLNGVKQNPYVN